MSNIKINLWVIVAVIAMVAIVFFTVQAIQQQNYTGSEVTVNSTGLINIQTASDAPIMVTASSRRTFNVTTNNADVRTMRPTREGTGSAARYISEVEFPASQVELNVTRGSDVDFVITTADSASLDVTVAARSAEDNRNLVIMAIVGIIGLLIFISFQTEHQALSYLRNQFLRPGGRDGKVDTASA
ncbi:MAG: hypothetical protein RLP44_27895 [Aggregatilineales bacterium]